MGWSLEGDRRFVCWLWGTVAMVYVDAGQYGTGPVSYFVFLRFLLLTNLLMFLIWFAFVCVPQISWRYNDGKNMILQPARSQLHCLRPCNGSITCPPGTVTVYTCDATSNESVVINLCTDDECTSDNRPKEDTTMVTVCVAVNDSGTRYCVFDNVDPEVGGLQWIVDFITGQVSYTSYYFCHHFHFRVILIELCSFMDNILMEQ